MLLSENQQKDPEYKFCVLNHLSVLIQFFYFYVLCVIFACVNVLFKNEKSAFVSEYVVDFQTAFIAYTQHYIQNVPSQSIGDKQMPVLFFFIKVIQCLDHITDKNQYIKLRLIMFLVKKNQHLLDAFTE